METHIGLERESFSRGCNPIISVAEKIDITRPGYPIPSALVRSLPSVFGQKCTSSTAGISLKSENNSTKLSTCQEITSETINVRTMTDNTLHNLLYYIYTGKVHLHLDQFCHDCEWSRNSVCPKVTHPLELYHVALKYEFEMLVARCFHYLLSTVTPINIYERVVSLWPLFYLHGNELSVFYLDYLAENFNVVKERDELISAMEKDTEDLANQRLKEIMTEVKKRQKSE